MNISELFPADFLPMVSEWLTDMIEAGLGTRAAVLATVDGFLVASAQADASDPDRIAALASSIASIGTVATHEAGLGQCSSVILNTARGFAVVRQFRLHGHDLVLISVADGSALLAQVLYQANEWVKHMEAVAA